MKELELHYTSQTSVIIKTLATLYKAQTKACMKETKIQKIYIMGLLRYNINIMS